jgi:TrpR family trp operon transcriptional repressor
MKNKVYIHELIKKILSLKTEEELLHFFEIILTTKELEEIPTRLQIARLLKNGVSQRNIAKKLRVGIATVTRGSKELQNRSVEDSDI